jgi:prepilin-type N-terminal cleavage/methylation domain-containing protein
MMQSNRFCPAASGGGAFVASRRAFTLIEMLVVIAIIGLLAAMIVGGASHVRETSVRNRVRAEMNQVVTAIESYHKKFGFYPPDNPNNPASPPLYYELTGNTNLLDKPTILALFSVKGFVNSQADENERVPNFFPNLGVENKGYREINATPKACVLTVPVPGTDPINPDLNPWRYVSKNPTNNSETYDLWAEVKVGNKTIVIGNWKD